MRVKVKKLKESDAAKYKAATWEDYQLGVDNGDISLPVDYEVTGQLVYDLDKKPCPYIFVKRDSRNGVEVDGIFISSQIVNIKKGDKFWMVETANSFYRVEEI